MNKKAFLKGYLEKMAQATNTPQTVAPVRYGPSPGKEGPLVRVGKPQGGAQAVERVDQPDEASRLVKMVEQVMGGGGNAKDLGKMTPSHSSKNAPVMRVQSGK